MLALNELTQQWLKEDEMIIWQNDIYQKIKAGWAKSIIISATDAERDDGFGSSGMEPPFWTPTSNQIFELEQTIGTYLIEHPPFGEQPVEFSNYGRQYYGAVKNGVRVIYINAFCNPIEPGNPAYIRQRKELVIGIDGGSCYFQVLYNPDTNEFFDLHYNGNA
jgi:hypothetical protein